MTSSLPLPTRCMFHLCSPLLFFFPTSLIFSSFLSLNQIIGPQSCCFLQLVTLKDKTEKLSDLIAAKDSLYLPLKPFMAPIAHWFNSRVVSFSFKTLGLSSNSSHCQEPPLFSSLLMVPYNLSFPTSITFPFTTFPLFTNIQSFLHCHLIHKDFPDLFSAGFYFFLL